ncbi:hypothetical protein FRC10_009464 [Ceratobasidium sp. 414]|nr:hypothetical protein FRC10_009464 [Ceratobasidium sp. 414]
MHDLGPPPSSSHPTVYGGFGFVYNEKLRDRRRVAIKALRVSLNADDEADKLPKVIQHTLSKCETLISSQRAAQELYTWSKCTHPNVLPLLGLAKFQDQIRMVSLWMENRNLPSYLDKHPELSRCDMSIRVCKGLEYLHRTGVIHGDLKGNNVLVSNEGVPMITDFGNAVLQQGTLQFTETVKQSGFTPRWTAPEIMDEREVKQSEEADVYALGMADNTGIIYLSYTTRIQVPHVGSQEVITGKLPYFYINNMIALMRAIGIKNETPKRPEESIPSNSQHGDALWSLLQSCWEFEPEKRPDAAEVVEIVRPRPSTAAPKANICESQMKGITREGLVPAPTESEEQAETGPVSGRPSKRRCMK